MARRTVENDLPTMNDEDKHKLFTCPYNKYHRITALKYPGHVALCRKVTLLGHIFQYICYTSALFFKKTDYRSVKVLANKIYQVFNLFASIIFT